MGFFSNLFRTTPSTPSAPSPPTAAKEVDIIWQGLLGATCTYGFPEDAPDMSVLTEEGRRERIRQADELLRPSSGGASPLTYEQLVDIVAVARGRLREYTKEPEQVIDTKLARLLSQLHIDHLQYVDGAWRPRVIDLRGARYREMQDSVERGAEAPRELTELLPLLEAARAWGKANGNPRVDQFPQYVALQQIGRSIDRRGGLEAMQQVALFAIRHSPAAEEELKWFWNGVGQWRA